MQAVWNGQILAESDETVQVEGNHYFPPGSLHMEFFADSEMTSVCGWKGKANYYTVRVGDDTNKDCAWYYAEPNEAASKIKGMVAFWNGVEIR